MSQPVPAEEVAPAAIARHPDEAVRRSRERSLAWLAAGLVAIGALPFLAPSAQVDWRAEWLVACLLAGATAFGAFELYAAEEPRGVPIETLVTPALCGVAVLAAVPASILLGLHPAIALVVALGLGVPLMRAALAAEVPFLRAEEGVVAGDRRVVEALLMAAAFLCFLGVAATLPGGWPVREVDLPGQPLGEFGVALGVADALVASLVGYRLAALAAPDAPGVGWTAGTYGVLVGAASVVLRWLAIPGLLGPALLVLVLYLWSIIRARAVSAEGPARRPLEIFVLALVGLIVLLYQLIGR